MTLEDDLIVDVPEQPNWDALLEHLHDAEAWLLSEESDDETGCCVALEGVGLALAMLTSFLSDTPDENMMTREFFSRIDYMAFRFQLMGFNEDDPKLAEYVSRFCVNPLKASARLQHFGYEPESH